MAIPYFQVTAQSRGKGSSTVAKAAYNAGANLHDLDGRLHSYTARGGIKARALIFSPAVQGPHETREAFWQAVERSEKRKDACVSRELQCALPCELTYEQNKALALEFTQIIITRYRLRAADLSIHYPNKRHRKKNASDHENPHIHLLIPDRNADGKKIGMNRNRNEIFDLRHIWELHVNTYLAKAGLETRISLKTLESQIEEIKKNYRILIMI